MTSRAGASGCSSPSGSRANVDSKTSGDIDLTCEVTRQVGHVGTVESQVALLEYDCIRGLDPAADQHL